MFPLSFPKPKVHLFNDTLTYFWLFLTLNYTHLRIIKRSLSEKRDSSCGRIWMIIWWVFMLHQKAVWMLFEDWLEYKTSSCASPESLLSGFFLCCSSSSTPITTLLVDCLFHAVFLFFTHCDHREEARRAVLILRLESISSDFQQEPPVSPWVAVLGSHDRLLYIVLRCWCRCVVY